MSDRKQDKINVTPQPPKPKNDTQDAIDSDQMQEDADEMANKAARSEQQFDNNRGIFDKI